MIMAMDRFTLRAYGRQKKSGKGNWEDGLFLKKKAKRPLGRAELAYFLDHQQEIPAEWGKKLICFFGAVFSEKQMDRVMSKEGSIPLVYDKEFVPFIYRVDAGWKLDAFALDDEFGPTRLSAELKPQPIWSRIKEWFRQYVSAFD